MKKIDKILLPLIDSPPVFNENDSVIDFMRSVNDYNIVVKKVKYDLLLEILSKIFNKKIKTLTDVKNIKIELDNAEKIIYEHKEIITSNFCEIIMSDDKIDVLNTLKKMCGIIDYKFIIGNELKCLIIKKR